MNKCKKCGDTLELGSNWRKCWAEYYVDGKLKPRLECSTCAGEIDAKSNATRIWLDKEYIKKGNPLYDSLFALLGAGYHTTKQVCDAAEKVSEQKDGYIYIVVNERSYPGWIKIGMTIDPIKRLSSYQIGTPYADYEMVYKISVADRRKAEKAAHKKARKICDKHYGKEWFKMSVDLAKEIING